MSTNPAKLSTLKDKLDALTDAPPKRGFQKPKESAPAKRKK